MTLPSTSTSTANGIGSRPARVEQRRHDRHRLVPRRLAGVVGPGDAEHVALAHLDPPLRRRHGHGDVPGDRARRLVVLRARAEQARRAAVARELEVGPQPAGMEVPCRADERAVLGHRPAVGPRPADLLRVLRAVVPAAGPALGVEHRVGAADGVEPGRLDLGHRRRGRRAVRDEVEVVGDVDLRRGRREVVDHVVHVPRVRGQVAPAVARRRAEGGLLLAGREQRLQVLEPHPVVQVDDVHARDGPVLHHEVRREARDPAVHRRLERVVLERDRVLPRLDLHGAELVVERLHVLRRRGCREQETEDERGEGDSHDVASMVWIAAAAVHTHSSTTRSSTAGAWTA